MPRGPIKVDTSDRLSRNLGLLQAGSMVTLDIATPAGQRAKFKSIFVGYLPKQYVLVQYPDASKMGSFSQHIKQGTSVTVRGLIEGHEGSIVAFASHIKQTLQLPSKLIALAFPKSVSLQQLRASLRIDTDISAKLNIANEYWASHITDISISGCQLSVDNGDSLALVKDKDIEIVVEDLDEISNIKIKANICSVKPSYKGVTIGVKFVEGTKEATEKLLKHIVTSEQQ